MKEILKRVINRRTPSSPHDKQAAKATRQLKQTRRQLKETRRQLRQLAREYVLCKMPKGSVCAEIGVHEGDFSAQILSTVEPKKLHLIDPWKHEEEVSCQESRYGGLGSDGQVILDERYQKVNERFDKEIRTGTVEVHRGLSSAVSEVFERSYFDWIYIDGNHLYEFVKQDLELYLPVVKTDGYMVGDDYGVQGWWNNGVQEAVDEFVSRTPGVTLEVKGSQFILKMSGRTEDKVESP